MPSCLHNCLLNFVLFAVIILLMTTMVLLTASFIITSLVVAVYVISRLVLLLHWEGSVGFPMWLDEMKAMLPRSPPQLMEGDEGSEASALSGVRVHEEKLMKVESK